MNLQTISCVLKRSRDNTNNSDRPFTLHGSPVLKRILLDPEELGGRITPVAGALDPSFSSDGLILQDVAGYTLSGAEAVLVQPDGKVVVAGVAQLENTNVPAIFRYNANGTPDGTFSLGGFGLFNVSGGSGQLYSVAIQPDGKIVASGTANIAGNYQVLLLRLNSDGTPDATFGTAGVVLTDLTSGNDNGFAVAIQSDGKIVVGGAAQTDPGSSTARMLALRFTADGTLDTTFSGDGIVQLDFGPTDAAAKAVLVQPDGKIVLAGLSSSSGGNFGFALARLNANGSLDTTFDGDGLVKTAPGNIAFQDIRDAVLLPDGKIIAVGTAAVGQYYKPTPVLLRYTATGALDNSFDTDGIVLADLPHNGGEGNAVAVQSDGKILLAGAISIPGGSQSILGRYTTSGQLDTTFGPADQTLVPGIVVTDLVAGDNDGYRAVAVAPDGRIVAAGVAGGGSVQQLAVARYDHIDLPAVTVADAYLADKDTVLTVDGPGILANDSVPGGAPISIVVTQQPTHGTLELNQAGGFTYTPDPDFIGADGFEYRIDNGLQSEVATVVIVVRPAADPPTPQTTSASTGGDLATSDPKLLLESGVTTATRSVDGSGATVLTLTYTFAANEGETVDFTLGLNGETIWGQSNGDDVIPAAPGTVSSLDTAMGVVVESPTVSVSSIPAEGDSRAILYTVTVTVRVPSPVTFDVSVNDAAIDVADEAHTGASSGPSTLNEGGSAATEGTAAVASSGVEYEQSLVLTIAVISSQVDPGLRRDPQSLARIVVLLNLLTES
ncbi:MAG: hypothetical protein C0467_14655 [Planctomycetaceae bacterium]|nr:hypothetical protein [Planctomycetaceae bacterium]